METWAALLDPAVSAIAVGWEITVETSAIAVALATTVAVPAIVAELE